MKLITNCNNCEKEITFSGHAKDRVEFLNKKGEKIELTCRYCEQTGFYHVNRIYATENKKDLLFATFIFLFGTPLIFYLIWDYLFRFSQIYVIAGMTSILGFPFLIYSLIDREQRKKVQRFNSYRVHEH